ncbi:MAG: GntR family transcriptional regulator [Pseudomonadota bacterium]|nr:GntR family transcriptional regulator [Pseudomonadota bacterium]
MTDPIAIPSAQKSETGDAVCIGDHALRGDQAYERLRVEIISCRLLPGAQLTEAAIMDRFGLGKSSCRIALVRLVQVGLVRSIPRQGYVVVPVTVKDVEEIFALRLQLEPYAARMAVGKVDRAQLERLERACRVQVPGDVGNQIDFFLDANRSFHMAIADASGNQRLSRTLSGLLDEMTRLVALGFGVQRVRPAIKHDHELLIEHLASGDARGAETVARRHVETFREMTMEKVLASLRDSAALTPVVGLPIPRSRDARG